MPSSKLIERLGIPELADRRIQITTAVIAAICFVAAVGFTLILGSEDLFTKSKTERLIGELETIQAEHVELSINLAGLLASIRQSQKPISKGGSAVTSATRHVILAAEVNQALAQVDDLQARRFDVDARGNRFFSGWKNSIKKVPGRENRRPLIAEFKRSEKQMRHLNASMTNLRKRMTPVEIELQIVSGLLKRPGVTTSEVLTRHSTRLAGNLRSLTAGVHSSRAALTDLASVLPPQIALPRRRL